MQNGMCFALLRGSSLQFRRIHCWPLKACLSRDPSLPPQEIFCLAPTYSIFARVGRNDCCLDQSPGLGSRAKIRSAPSLVRREMYFNPVMSRTVCSSVCQECCRSSRHHHQGRHCRDDIAPVRCPSTDRMVMSFCIEAEHVVVRGSQPGLA